MPIKRAMQFKEWLRSLATSDFLKTYHFIVGALRDQRLTDLQRQEVKEKLELCKAEYEYRRAVA